MKIILMILMITSTMVRSGTVEYYKTDGGTPDVFDNCTINWIFLTDIFGVDQVDVSCDTAPADDIILNQFDRVVYVNGVSLSCELNDMLMQNNDNFVIRLNCIDDDLIFIDRFEP